ncbi:hypothetical protein PG988_012524 [Apiospora saccharicola]
MAVMNPEEDSDDGSQSTTLESRPASSHLHRHASTASCPVTKQEHDGHRWCECDRLDSAALATGRSNGNVNGSSSGLQRLDLRRTATRADSVVARIRSRGVPTFTHPLARHKTTTDSLVDFDGPGDPYHPLNWSTHKKVGTTLLYGLVTMTATWASSSYSAGTTEVAREFGVDQQVAVLGSSLFLLGFGLGPLVWAPLSEVYGRRLAVLTPMFIAICFSFGSAVAKDLQTLIVTRFFGAFFASAPVTNTGGVLGDLFTPDYRGIAMAGYAMAVVGGPTLGPIVSAAVVAVPYLGWRWTQYLTGILQAVVLLAALIFIDESYPSRLLVVKARRLRLETGNWALHAKFEEWDVSILELARKFLVRPLQLLSVPSRTSSGELRGWSPFMSELPFLAILLGSVTGAVINVLNQLQYNRAYRANGCRAVPERRLPPMMLGSVLFASSLFLTGWTADPATGCHWIVPVIGLYLAGTGFNTIFQAALNYLVDTFQAYAASAVAANTFLRSCFAAAFPLVVSPLYHNVGVGPGQSIFGGFACLLVPVPFVFYVYGRRVRVASKWSKGGVYD